MCEEMTREIAGGFNVELGQKDRTESAMKSSFRINSRKGNVLEDSIVLSMMHSCFCYICYIYKPFISNMLKSERSSKAVTKHEDTGTRILVDFKVTVTS